MDRTARPHVGENHACTGLARNWRRQADSWFTLFEIGATRSEDCFGAGTWFDEKRLQSRIYVSTDFGTEVYQGTEYELAGLSTFGELRLSNMLGLSWEMIAGDGIDYDNNRKGRLLRVEPAASVRLGRHLKVTANHGHSTMDVDLTQQGRTSFVKFGHAWVV